MRFFLSTAVVLATAAGVAAHVGAPGAGPRDGRMELIASVKHVVSVTSSPVTGLYPGAVRPLIVRVKNTYSYPVKVATVKTTVGAATNRSGCAGTRENMLVSRNGGATTIKPRKTVSIVMTVVMPKTVADACQGATFTFTFAARAVRA
jgi:L-cystine uptake protein TcyP (sodium:dicarboxylate symporter family)